MELLPPECGFDSCRLGQLLFLIMPRIPINHFDQEWEDEELEHDHLGRPLNDRRPKKPKPSEQEQVKSRRQEPLPKNNN